MSAITKLLHRHEEWLKKQKITDGGVFERLYAQQKPRYLWIGCIDSRVPAEIITGQDLGEMLVHRNIANQVVLQDVHTQALLQFSLDVLKIRTIIVAGHSNCGGVKAVLSSQTPSNIKNWVSSIYNAYRRYADHLDRITCETIKENTLSALNVIDQVVNVANNITVQQCWSRGESLMVHGLMYDLKSGVLRDLDVSVGSLQHALDLSDKALRLLSRA